MNCKYIRGHTPAQGSSVLSRNQNGSWYWQAKYLRTSQLKIAAADHEQAKSIEVEIDPWARFAAH